MTLDTNPLFHEFASGLQRLARGPFERSPPLAPRHDRLLAAGPTPIGLPHARRDLPQEHAAEMLLERGEHRLQIAVRVRDHSRRVVFIELQRMAAGAMLFHANRYHGAPTGIGLMAITAREL